MRRESTPEDYLAKAMTARSPASRASFARRGLATRAPLDPTTHAMLLRQLYLSHYEARRFARALEVAEQALHFDILPDVIHQDLARSALALGRVDDAVGHLRLAVRRSPASRRAFHHWTLGSILFHAHRYPEAIAALERAIRWGTRDKPLYRAHLALVRLAAGESIGDEVQEIINELAESPSGQGYGRFVLGHLAYAAGEWKPATRYLDAFVKRAEASRSAMHIALEPELRMAKATLAKMSAN